MSSITLLGSDGSGKSTVTKRLERFLPTSKVIYMGVSLESSNHLLPTSRLVLAVKGLLGRRGDSGPPDPARRKPVARGWKRPFRVGAEILRTLNLMAEEWYRQGLAAYHQLRGRTVIFDRHFYADYYYHGIERPDGLTPIQRFHVWTLRRLYPRPELVVILDAPSEELLRRKGEGTLRTLEDRRREYLRLIGVLPDVVVVDATQPLEAVVQRVVEVIRNGTRERDPKRTHWGVEQGCQPPKSSG